MHYNRNIPRSQIERVYATIRYTVLVDPRRAANIGQIDAVIMIGA